MDIVSRFMRFFQQGDGCWEWKGSLNHSGYGVFYLPSTRQQQNKTGAHRFSWEHFIGPIPDDLQVLHRCDNRKCVNPNHLFLGTNDDNVKDKVAKERQVRGEQHGASKLTEADVREIKRSQSSLNKLAAQYGVHRSQISNIKRGINWAFVSPD